MKLPVSLLIWYAKYGFFSTLRQSAFRKIARGQNGTERVILLRAGFRMRVRIGDPVDTGIAIFGVFESGLTNLISKLALRLESFVDVGCNIGYVTCHFRNINADAPILAIDANPLMISRAKENANLNNYTGIHWENIGIGQGNGELDLHINDDRPSQASFGVGAATGKISAIRTHKIKIESLPTVILRSKIENIGLLKIDIEGFEPALFQGLPAEFMPRIKRMIFEYAPGHIAKCGFSQDLLPNMPWWSQYRCFGLKGDRPSMVPLRPQQFSLNEWDGIYAERIDLPEDVRLESL